MSIATGSDSELGYLLETVSGVAEVGRYTRLRRVNASELGLSKDTFDSEEIRGDRTLADSRHGTRLIDGGVETEVSTSSYDIFWAALLGSRFWTTAAAELQGLSVTMAAAPANTITSSSSSFLTAGFVLGDRVFVSGSSVPGNNGAATVLGISSNGLVLTVDKDLAAWSGALEIFSFGKRVLVGDTLLTFSLERAYRGLTPPRYETLSGVAVSGVNVSLDSTGMATTLWTFVGKDSEGLLTTSLNTYDSGLSYKEHLPVASVSTTPLVAVNGMLAVETSTGIRRLATVTEFEFTIDNGIDGSELVGSNTLSDLSFGTDQAVTGKLVVLFEDEDLYNVFEAEGEATLIFRLDGVLAGSDEHLTFTMPRCRFSSGDIGDEASAGLPVEMEFTALSPGDLPGSLASQVIVSTSPVEGRYASALLPTLPPWEQPFTSISRSRIVVAANSDVTWSHSVCVDYCAARGIPESNIVDCAVGHGATTADVSAAWSPSPATMATIATALLTPLKNKCVEVGAQGILMGPAFPIIVWGPKSGGGVEQGEVSSLVSMAMGLPPDPVGDLSAVYASKPGWVQNLGATFPPDEEVFAIDVTTIVDDIRASAGFNSGNRMNFWARALSSTVWCDFHDRATSGGFGARLQVVQGGIEVYSLQITAVADDGVEVVGAQWSFLTSRVGGLDSLAALGYEVVATWSFPTVTVDPLVTVTSATLTLYTNYLKIHNSGDIRVWGEDQTGGDLGAWSNTHKPIGSSAVPTASSVDFTVTADPDRVGLSGGWSMGLDSFQPNLTYAEAPFGGVNSLGDLGAIRDHDYPFPTGGGGPSVGGGAIFTPAPEATAAIGTEAHYDQTYDNKGRAGYPTLPVGRIGMNASPYAYNGGLPEPETEALDREIIDNTTAAFAAHDWAASLQKPILFHAASFPSGYGFSDRTMYLYHLCQAWGMTGIKYAYAETSAATVPYAESYAPISGNAYLETAVFAGSVDEDFYFMFGNWLNLTNDAPYAPPYSTAWTPLPGAGVITGPSQGWQYGLQALRNGGSCALTDTVHIGTSHMAQFYHVFYNLLRGMTWLEAGFYGMRLGNMVVGDPLWAPFGKDP